MNTLKYNILIITFIFLQNLFQKSIVESYTSERQHEFRGIIKPNILFFNGIPRPIVYKVEIKCLHGCDNYFRFYLQSTIDKVEEAGLFIIHLMAGKEKDGSYKRIKELRVHIKSLDLLAGHFREYTWENVVPKLDKVHEFQFGHFEQILDEPFYLNFRFIEVLPPLEMSINCLIKFKKYVASVHEKSSFREAISIGMMSEVCPKFSEKELTEKEYLGIEVIKMELNEYSGRVSTKRTLSLDRLRNFPNFLNYLENNENHSLNFFVKQVPICGICRGSRHNSIDSIFKLKNCNDYFHKECINSRIEADIRLTEEQQESEALTNYILKSQKCPICDIKILLDQNYQAIFDQDEEIKETIIYHVLLKMPILQNGEYPHYIYYIGQQRERKEYNRIRIIEMSQEEEDDTDEGSDTIKSETSMDKRRKKGKFKLDEPKSPVMKRHTRLIDLFKKSPINMESLVKLSRRIERKERKMEKEKKKEEIYLKIREVVEDSTSNVKKESEGIQKDLEKEELKEEEEIPLKRRTKEKEQEIRRERRSKSHPIESNPLSVGVLQLPNRSYSDQEATSKMASQGIREEFEDLITKQKTKSYQDTTQIEQQEKEIEKISTDESINIYKKENIDSSNIKLWDWEGIDCSYQADSSSSQTSPLNRGQPSASCEIIEEPEEEEKIVKHNISSPWFSEEEYLEKIENLESNEDKNKEKKSTKILKRCKKQLRKLTPNKLKHSIRRTVSDIIHKKTKPIIV